MHSAVTVSALQAGKHVFCQARMAMDIAEAEEMLAASKSFPELVTMLCPPPWNAGDLLVKKLLAEDYIGRPHHVRLQSFASNYLDRTLRRIGGRGSKSADSTCSHSGFISKCCIAGSANNGVFARGKVIQPIARATNILPDLLTVLCAFDNGAEGCSSLAVSMRRRSDRVEIYGTARSLTISVPT